ncbi:MAG: cysteine desulfurase [Terrimicrobiaceae bacterium]
MTPDSNNGKTPDCSGVRADFPILDQQVNGHPLIYFDNAATSQKPRAVIRSLVEYFEKDNSNVHRGLHELSNRATAAYEGARGQLARFVGCGEDELIFTRGTTESVNLVARSWGETCVGPGDVILLSEMEHHSNLVPWQMLAQRRGASLRFVPLLDDGRLNVEAVPGLLQGPVKLFAFTHVSNSLGTINPAAELCAMARAAGVASLVDAAQSAGHMPLDFPALGCDFLVFSGHKMCGPTGIGVLCVRREVLDSMPPFHGGGEMIANAGFETSSYKDGPQRFEAGTPAIAEAIGLGVAARYLDRVGREAIFQHDQVLVGKAMEVLGSVPGLRIIGPRTGRAGLVSFVIDGVHAHDIVSLADQYGLALRGGHHCTQPLLRKLGVPVSARASFYLYNTVEEIERMGSILERIVRLLA